MSLRSSEIRTIFPPHLSGPRRVGKLGALEVPAGTSAGTCNDPCQTCAMGKRWDSRSRRRRKFCRGRRRRGWWWRNHQLHRSLKCSSHPGSSSLNPIDIDSDRSAWFTRSSVGSSSLDVRKRSRRSSMHSSRARMPLPSWILTMSQLERTGKIALMTLS
eukprot:767686-Hanusia_phi.AAC.2